MAFSDHHDVAGTGAPRQKRTVASTQVCATKSHDDELSESPGASAEDRGLCWRSFRSSTNARRRRSRQGSGANSVRISPPYHTIFKRLATPSAALLHGGDVLPVSRSRRGDSDDAWRRRRRQLSPYVPSAVSSSMLRNTTASLQRQRECGPISCRSSRRMKKPLCTGSTSSRAVI